MSRLNHSYSGKRRPRGRQPSKSAPRPPASQRPIGLANARRGALKTLSRMMGAAPPEPRDLKSLRMRPVQSPPGKSRPKLAVDRQLVKTKKIHRTKRVSPLVYISRLAILGVGLGAIAGTILASWNPHGRLAAKNPTPATQPTPAAVVANPPKASTPAREILPLKTQIETLAAKYPQLTPEVFMVDLDSGNYVNLAGNRSISAASTIKVPILVALLQEVDAGKVRLDEKLVLTPDAIGGGSGGIQYQKIGTQFTLLEVATKTIVVSDNTATNMIIKRLGGAAKLNSRFQSWGLTATAIKNPLPDLEGTNTTSPKDLVEVMAMVNRGELISMRSRDRLLGIMRQTVTNTLLPQGLGKGATISHKTGDIGSVVGDVGLIDMPSGKRYLAAVMVRRPHNNPKAQELIRQISRVTYNYFSQPAANSQVTSPKTNTNLD
jgi:beta-lactamase class A